MTSLGCFCRHSERIPQSHNCWDDCSLQGKMGEEEMGDKRDRVTEVESMRNLGRTEMFSWMRVGILVCVVVVAVLVVVVVLMRVMGGVCLGACFLPLV